MQAWKQSGDYLLSYNQVGDFCQFETAESTQQKKIVYGDGSPA